MNHHLSIDLYYDSLAWIMLTLVSFISLIIHRYAERYLDFDLNRLRFLAQLSLLTFSAMLLMLSGSLLTAFVAWQFIGLSLYFLLNHYHFNLQANKAAKKKFIINRIGDICFLLATIITIQQYGTSQFTVLFHEVEKINYIIPTLIFIAIMTKAAQFPFHIWLIDTMEAPTPVSAMMHAGIINSGGFLLVRLSPLYTQVPQLMLFIVIVGLTTALLGYLFMKSQPDVKKQLAYSTMSQMGYMILQCGISCFPSAIFHLIYHGFFKATQFLSSGSTLKYSNQTGLRAEKEIKRHFTSLIIALALTLLSIFFTSKTHQINNQLIWIFTGVSLYQMYEHLLNMKMSKLIMIITAICLTIIFAFYVMILEKFSAFIPSSPPTSDNTTTSWYILLTMSGLMILSLLFMKFIAEEIKNKILRKTYLFVLYKGNIEKYYRDYLVAPLRKSGDSLAKLYSILPKFIRYLAIISLTLYFILTINNSISEVHQGTNDLHLRQVLMSLGLLLMFLVTANRIVTISQFSYTIFLSTLALCVATLSLGKYDMSVVALFQLVNSTMLLIAFVHLVAKNDQPNSTGYITHNRLTWRQFYISTLLTLLIGIPGTASFINELFVFNSLLLTHYILAAGFGVIMILFALVILHVLQAYIFNPDSIHRYTAPVTVIEHCLTSFAIGFNIINGLFPSTLIQLIRQTLGG